jgi:branched-chain amino acid transport system ATP-binding protein
MLTLENVSLNYGSFRALNGVTLNAKEGELVVLLGANGAGKSSIFLTTSGIHKAGGGSIKFRNTELVGMKASQIVSTGVVQCPEGRKLFPQMSVLKNLTLGAYVHRGDKAGNQRMLDDVFTLFPILAERMEQPAGSLSGGQQQMVAIGRAMMGRPKALLLDEPSLGLAPLITRELFRQLGEISSTEGLTMLVVEQNATLALGIADRGYVLETGTIVASGPADQLAADESVRKAYLGF